MKKENMEHMEKTDRLENKIGVIVLGAVQASILFYPVWMLSIVFSWENYLIPFWVEGIASIFYGLAIYSNSIGQACLKWLCSLPLTIGFWCYFSQINFVYRALNWTSPGYGDMSAGGGFAMMILVVFLLICCFFTGLTAILLSLIRKSASVKRVFHILQHIVCSVVCAGILAAVFCFQMIMPTTFPELYG